MTDNAMASVLLCGARAEATAQILAARLQSLGRSAAMAGNCVTFEATPVPGSPEQRLEIELSPYDEAEFAAEKILDTLEERGLIAIGSDTVTGEEEARLRDRLRRLGYIE